MKDNNLLGLLLVFHWEIELGNYALVLQENTEFEMFIKPNCRWVASAYSYDIYFSTKIALITLCSEIFLSITSIARF